MGYKEKIQILEKNIADLDSELKSVRSAIESTANSEVIVINSIIDDVNILGTEISQTKEQTQKLQENPNKDDFSKAEVDIKTRDLDLQKIRKRMKISFALFKQHEAHELESLRLQSKIIRQISVSTSDYLDSKILELEILIRKYIGRLNAWADEPDCDIKILPILAKDMSELRSSMDSNIGIARNCIKSTIDKFKD